MLAFTATARAAEPDVKAVRLTTLDFRPAIRVLTEPSVPAGPVVREGGVVRIKIPGTAPETLALPKLEPPLEELTLEREPGFVVLTVKVAPEVPFEASHEPGMLTVVFGELPAPELRGPVTAELYGRLFPPVGTEAGSPPSTEGAPGDGAAAEGLRLGRLTLRPYISAAYVNADVLAFSSPVPVRDRYLQVAPGVTASMPIGHGLLSAEYEPRLRFFATIPEVGETSHMAAARLELPLGSRTQLRLAHRYTRATLETTVVDPGREYFYDLERYTYNDSSALLRVDLGARLWVEGEGRFSWNRFDVPQQAGFFDFDNRALRAGLGYDIGNELRATVSYSYDRLPPSPDRALVESNAQSVLAMLQGDLGPLTQASLTAGFRHQANPLATGESRSYDGFTLGGSLRRELGRAMVAELQFNRTVDPSGYDTNAYYVNNSILGSLTAPLPFEFWARGGLGLPAQPVPEPRAGTERAATRRDPGLERRDRPRPRLARVRPRRLPARPARVERAGIRRHDLGLRGSGGPGAVRARAGPPMMLGMLLMALLQAAPAPAPRPTPVPDDAASSVEGEYEVGAGDVLEINVFGNDDLSRVPTVQTNGSVSLPLLGEVQVAGLTIAEVKRKVTNLLAKDYLINPQVEVKVKEYQSQYVSVVGEVNNPGRKPIRGRMRLIDALLESGGFKASSSGEVMITRTDGGFEDGQKTMTVRISSSATIQDQINLELRLKNGDIISALPKAFVTVDGEVNRPGRYAIEADLTVTGAISLAGGLSRFGSGDVKVRRTDPQTGKVTILKVDLKAVRNGKKPDVPLLPNDVVSVPRRVF